MGCHVIGVDVTIGSVLLTSSSKTEGSVPFAVDKVLDGESGVKGDVQVISCVLCV